VIAIMSDPRIAARFRQNFGAGRIRRQWPRRAEPVEVEVGDGWFTPGHGEELSRGSTAIGWPAPVRITAPVITSGPILALWPTRRQGGRDIGVVMAQ
jgi:hypothetical protein